MGAFHSRQAVGPSDGLGLPQPYLLFLGDVDDARFAKTAFGLKDWAPQQCIGEWAAPQARITVGLPRLSPCEARAKGARSLVIGVANSGGSIPPSWLPMLIEAMRSGLDLVSGMHVSLRDFPQLREEAHRLGRSLIDVRRPPAGIPVGSGRKRSGKRLLTVGTDCALGKKYTALAITRELERQGIAATFRATGQTGIMIAGHGIPMDAVVSDFLSGAAEMLSPDAPDKHWDVIEGQGSLFHPSYAGVSLGLLHGSQPDVIVVCHDPQRTGMIGVSGFPVPSVSRAVALNLEHAKLVNAAARCGGISLNTSAMEIAEAMATMAVLERETGLPVADPMRFAESLSDLVSNSLKAPAGDA